MSEIDTRCVIAGGGPAGMMLGYLLARAGVDVVVLEKYKDFFRDFRGDTIHPSTMQVLRELGLLEEFLKIKHQEFPRLHAVIDGEEFLVADFSHLDVACPFIALVPQWDFLNFIAGKAKAYQNFRLLMETEAIDLIEENGRVAGVRTKTDEIRAELVVGADGRHSTIRERSGLAVQDFGAPMDVLWFRISAKPDDPAQTLGRIQNGKMLITLGRGDYWQCAYLIPKGRFDEIRARGLNAFHRDVLEVAPFFGDRVREVADWDAVMLLSVRVDRLRQWSKEGLLCIGDAAHAMSPIGGVGINLAIQDAVAAANILAPRFQQGSVRMEDLEAVQKRREPPTRKTQALQVFLQNHFVSRVLENRVPRVIKLLRRLPLISRLPARFIGLGFLPEHVETEDVHKSQDPRP
jgi:2-polyprenyl-6-methoxyphenol hydroxylase-like FAD-dependent oxidoreductase